MRGKRYPDEFKIEAVKQVTDRGYTVTDVAARLGVTTKSLDVLSFQSPVKSIMS